MAEFIFRDMVRRQGLDGDFLCSSCATSTEEIWGDIGNPVYPPARDELKKHGLDCSGKRAVQLKKNDYCKYDCFLCMDKNNIKNALRIFGSDPEHKVKMLLDYTGEPRSVADPWYSGRFDVAYKDIYEGCEAFLNHLLHDSEE